MSEVIRSIFRQKEIEKLYRLKVDRNIGCDVYPYIPSSRVMAEGNYDNVISDKEIGRYDLDGNLLDTYKSLGECSKIWGRGYDIEIPTLEIGDEFFLHDIQEAIVIKSKMRSSDGSITYYAEDKIIETENTKKSYEECNNKVEHWNYEKERFEKLEKEFDEYKKKYKYKNRFFNKKLKN